jgi:cytochrome c peroxidase
MKHQSLLLWLLASVSVIGLFALAASHHWQYVETDKAHVNQFQNVAFGLPPLVAPDEILLAPEVIALGKALFFDKRLSFNQTMSCAMCHLPEEAFAATTSQVSLGMNGRRLRRNAPSLLNVSWQSALFHDGREFSLESQAWTPFLHADEMANPSVGYVLNRLKQLPEYPLLFTRAYGEPLPTMDRVGVAIAAFERTLISANSAFDRWQFGTDKSALNTEAQQGLALFIGKAKCSTCHLIGKKDALLTDGKYHDTGVGQLAKPNNAVLVQSSAMDESALTPKSLPDVYELVMPDLGRYEITKRVEDLYAFRTPSLRNVARTPPYMHDGSLATLNDVINFYDKGGGHNDKKNEGVKNGNVVQEQSQLSPLGLSHDEKKALLTFLGALNGQDAFVEGVMLPNAPVVKTRYH